MWIYLNDAFVSVVAHRERPDALLVRARRPGDLERLFPGAEVVETRAADYRFRTVLPRHQVAVAIARRLERIRYPNFKASVHEEDRHDVYLDVWSATLRGFAEEPRALPRRPQLGFGWHEPPPRKKLERRPRRRRKAARRAGQ